MGVDAIDYVIDKVKDSSLKKELYRELDDYISYGILTTPEKNEFIDIKHERNLFKLQLMQSAPQYGFPDILNYD